MPSKGMRIQKVSEIQVNWSQRSIGGGASDDEETRDLKSHVWATSRMESLVKLTARK
jgi:hypothetical protein